MGRRMLSENGTSNPTKAKEPISSRNISKISNRTFLPRGIFLTATKRLSPDTDSSQRLKSKGASANCRQMGVGVSPESSMRDSHRRGRLRIDIRIPIGNLIG